MSYRAIKNIRFIVVQKFMVLERDLAENLYCFWSRPSPWPLTLPSSPVTASLQLSPCHRPSFTSENDLGIRRDADLVFRG